MWRVLYQLLLWKPPEWNISVFLPKRVNLVFIIPSNSVNSVERLLQWSRHWDWFHLSMDRKSNFITYKNLTNYKLAFLCLSFFSLWFFFRFCWFNSQHFWFADYFGYAGSFGHAVDELRRNALISPSLSRGELLTAKQAEFPKLDGNLAILGWSV